MANYLLGFRVITNTSGCVLSVHVETQDVATSKRSRTREYIVLNGTAQNRLNNIVQDLLTFLNNKYPGAAIELPEPTSPMNRGQR